MSDISLTISEEKQNPLLYRKEVLFEISHQKAPSPEKVNIKSEISRIFTAEPDLIQIINMKTKTNTWKTTGTAHIYSSREKAKKIIPQHLFQRELPTEEKSKLKETKKQQQQKQKQKQQKKK